MTPSEIDEIIGTLVAVARPLILEAYLPDSCLQSTRIAVDALAYFGVSAAPLPVEARAFNRAWWEEMLADGDPRRRHFAHGRRLAWGRSLDRVAPDVARRSPVSWPYYLAAAVALDAGGPPIRLVDLSCDQVNDGSAQVELAPHFVVLPDDPAWHVPGGPPAAYPNGDCMIAYWLPAAPVPPFTTVPAWLKTGVTRRVTGAVIRAMRAALDAGSASALDSVSAP